jgi:hypothetical protein
VSAQGLTYPQKWIYLLGTAKLLRRTIAFLAAFCNPLISLTVLVCPENGQGTVNLAGSSS